MFCSPLPVSSVKVTPFGRFSRKTLPLVELPRNTSNRSEPTEKKSWGKMWDEHIDSMSQKLHGDFKVLMANKTGKIFDSQKTLFRPHKSVRFPPLTVYCLGTKQTLPLHEYLALHPTVFLIVSLKRLLSEPMVISWKDPLKERFLGNDKIQVAELIVNADSVWKMLNRFIAWYISSSLPKEHLPSTFLCTPSKTEMASLEELGYSNHYLAYPLIIHKGLIRWEAVGKATDKEIKTAIKLLESLEGEDDRQLKDGGTSDGLPGSPSTPSLSSGGKAKAKVARRYGKKYQ